MKSIKFAKTISTVFNPIFVAFAGDLLYIFVAIRPSSYRQLAPLLLFPFFHAILPLIILSIFIKKKKIADFDITRREERTVYFLILLLCFLSATVLSIIQTEYFMLNLAVTVALAVIILITLRWKISVHLAMDSLIFGLLAIFADRAFLFLMLLLPVIAWSRVKLKKHTPAQTVAGFILATMILISILFTASYASTHPTLNRYYKAAQRRTNSLIFDRIPEDKAEPLESGGHAEDEEYYDTPLPEQTDIEITMPASEITEGGEETPVQTVPTPDPQPGTGNWWSYPAEILPVQKDPNDLTVVVNKKYRLPSDYVPADLVNLGDTGLRYGDQKLGRAVIVDGLTALATAAKADGIDLAIKSAYRSYQQQQSTYNYWVGQEGGNVDAADKYSARPGHSEHQLGTTIDFTTNECGDCIGSRFTGTKADLWLRENANLYGFYLSYPEGQEHQTGYTYESWHYRYKGSSR